MKFSVKNPIPGFENIKEVEITKIDDFFVKMQDVDSKTSFTMINPYALRPDYEFDIPTPYKNLLQIDDNSKLELYAIVAISSPIEESTVNFLAPVLCNTTAATLAQIVLDNRYYPNFGQAEKISAYVQKQ
ncbi:flagellar assembly protein FliW [Campylobacter devanensis]|uniref:Flagellar assembly factor FliW n=1 Tax=Campylobacter devanensis TaxID=3161138 RepID=A0A1X9SSA7_9BACT|nr:MULTISPECIES: flagellar assembly protein FliW [Campylobacter]ARQ99154.1 flagellar assembly protein [Campylobacter lanienae]SUX02337.1 flagellar assembly protein FliW [Campylobacter lanienae]